MPARPDGSPTRSDVERLLPQVYEELHRLAQRYFRDQPPDHTLQATALVHEAYLKLSAGSPNEWNSRHHFYCAAAKVMRRILINHARDRGRLKRGGKRQRVPLDDHAQASPSSNVDLEALEEGLEELSGIDARKAQVVELRYFVGLSIDETADVLKVSAASVKSDWALAKAWLLRRVRGDDANA